MVTGWDSGFTKPTDGIVQHDRSKTWCGKYAMLCDIFATWVGRKLTHGVERGVGARWLGLSGGWVGSAALEIRRGDRTDESDRFTDRGIPFLLSHPKKIDP